MNLSFDFTETFDATIRGELTVAVPVAKLPEASLNAIFAYGLQRILNDSVGRAGKEDAVDDAGKRLYFDRNHWLEACQAQAEKKLDALLSGDVGRAASAPRDPVGAEIDRIAREDIRLKVKTQHGLTLKQLAAKHGEGKFDELVTGYKTANGAELRAQAEKNVAERADRAKDAAFVITL